MYIFTTAQHYIQITIHIPNNWGFYLRTIPFEISSGGTMEK